MSAQRPYFSGFPYLFNVCSIRIFHYPCHSILFDKFVNEAVIANSVIIFYYFVYLCYIYLYFHAVIPDNVLWCNFRVRAFSYNVHGLDCGDEAAEWTSLVNLTGS